MKRILVTVLISALVTLTPQHMAYAGDDEWTFLVSTNDIVSAFVFDPSNPSTFYAGERFVSKTTDGGNNWSVVDNGLTNPFVRALVFDPSNPSILYAGTRTGKVHKSTNGGNNWSALNNGLADTDVWSLAIDPGDRNTLFVSVSPSSRATIHKLTQTATESGVFLINAGLNGAWFFPGTDGQGFFIDVFPVAGVIFVAWFTFDTVLPDESETANLGRPGQRWLTAQGEFADNQAVLDVFKSEGGLFDTRPPIPTVEKDGTLTIEFSDCNTGTVSYNIPSIGRQGVVPIERILLDNVPLCRSLDGLT